jgi:hypothetical protein
LRCQRNSNNFHIFQPFPNAEVKVTWRPYERDTFRRRTMYVWSVIQRDYLEIAGRLSYKLLGSSCVQILLSVIVPVVSESQKTLFCRRNCVSTTQPVTTSGFYVARLISYRTSFFVGNENMQTVSFIVMSMLTNDKLCRTSEHA